MITCSISIFDSWIFPGLITCLTAVIGYFLKLYLGNVLKRLDILIDKISNLTEHIARHDEKFNSLDQRMDHIDGRLNEHHNDIRELKREHNKCKNFDPRP